ncbi:GDP-mannose 4,6-dehydratase [Candidatus Daviesbacteria bacterium]|nr:GDP-mannose 4,6-dehydratase [Candidatus Daviesbacteria bacterium]
MQKILVTGANGFAGQHLIPLLKSDYQIIGLINKSNLESSENVQYLNGNILDRGFLEDLIKKYQPEKIIHLAAIAPTWSQDPENIFKINLLGTLNLYLAVESAKKQNGYNPKIIYVSSAEVYGKTTNPEKIKEDSPFFPANYYGSSKVAADRLSYQMSQSAKLQIIIIRPFNHTGPGQLAGFFVPDMASQIVEIEKDPNRNEISVGNLDSIRDISDVRDIVLGYKLILKVDAKPGEAFNLCSGTGVKMKEVLKKLLLAAKKEIQIIEDPARMRPSEVPITVGDNSKFKNLTGWEPKIPLDQTLQDTLEYWRQRHE